MRKRDFALATWILVVGCGRSGEPEPLPPTAAEEPLTEQMVRAAMRSSTGAAEQDDTVPVFAGDAIYVDAMGRVDGGAAIAALWAPVGRNRSVELTDSASTNPEIVKWDQSEDLVWVLARAERGARSAGQAYLLTVLRRQADGELRVVAQMSVPASAE